MSGHESDYCCVPGTRSLENYASGLAFQRHRSFEWTEGGELAVLEIRRSDIQLTPTIPQCAYPGSRPKTTSNPE